MTQDSDDRSDRVAPAETDSAVQDIDATWERRLAQRKQQAEDLTTYLSWDARAVMRASLGWQHVRSDDDWRRIREEASEDYRRGSFLIDQLGAERLLDPKLAATLLEMRQALIEEFGATTPGGK